jgi:large subunit ribosomal protein L9
MPQVILLQDVEDVGAKGTVVDVSKGYLRNYLIPRKLAQPATKGLLEQARQATEAQARAQQQATAAAEENAAVLNRTVITISQQAGDDGRLFGSVTTQDIADAIKDARGLSLDRRKVHLEEPIRQVGTYQVAVEIGDGVTATVKTIVVDER